MRPRFPMVVAAAAVPVIFAGCASLERHDLFATGRDARVYDAQTGRYEWPDDAPARPPSKPRVTLREDAPETGGRRTGINPDDDRVFNPQTGRYEWPAR